MELSREIYWNVGHGAATLVPMYLLTLAAVWLLVKEVLKRRALYGQGQELNRTDQPKLRIKNMLLNALLQKKVSQQPCPGLFHSAFFWGFGLLLLGTALIVLQADISHPLFGVTFLKGTFYQLFSIVLDMAGLICLITLAGLLLRRYVFTPEGLPTKRDDAIMHALLFGILVTGFLIEGARMAVTELGTDLSHWSPVGLVVAKLLSGLGGEAFLRGLHLASWWVHLLLVMAFLAVIPLTKFRHIYMTCANYFFEDLGPKAKLAKLDLEAEDAESFGATSLQDLTWKDIFDTDACTSCMRCQNLCPAFGTGKPLSPMKLISQLGDAAALGDAEASLHEVFGEEALWACTTCGACQVNCPAAVEHVRKIVECRRALVLMEASFPPELQDTFTNMENQANPWGFGADTRADWAKGMDVPLMAEKTQAKVLWFVGCAGSFDDRGKKISQATARLLNKAGVDFAILGPEESCNGDMARRAGNEYLAQMMMMQNAETFSQYSFDTILTGCPHCYNTLKNEYPDFGASYEVVHTADFFAQLIKEGKLTVKARDMGALTFHDSCYLGRWNNIYESPREILKHVNSGGLVEMAQHRETSFCCGAGGARMFMEETVGERINSKRAEQVIHCGASQVAVACPFCTTMLNDGLKEKESAIEVKDIAELLDEATD